MTQSVPTGELARYRRHFHSHPELSLQEHETAAFIERELRDAGFDEIRTGIGTTGILGDARRRQAGAGDACCAPTWTRLPVTELNEVEYRSVIPGVMHACGHDGHMAILLCGGARTDRAGATRSAATLVFCFQPGEEGYAGNKLMIDDGALENPHVDRTFALHLYSGLDAGKIGVRDGAFFPSSDASRSSSSARAVTARCRRARSIRSSPGAQLVTLLQTIVSREIAPQDSGRRHRRPAALRNDLQRHSRAKRR